MKQLFIFIFSASGHIKEEALTALSYGIYGRRL